MPVVGQVKVELLAVTKQFNAGFMRAGSHLRRVVSDMRSMGFATAALAASITTLGASVASTFGEIEQSVVTAGAKMRATSRDVQALMKDTLKLSTTTEFTGRQVAKGFSSLGQRGLNASQARKAMPSVLGLATATETDPERAGDLLLGFLQVQQKGMEYAADAADMLTAAHNRSAATIDELSQGLSFVGSDAIQAGMGIEEVVAMLGALRSLGPGTLSKTARGVSMAMRQMQKMRGESGSAGQALADLGLDKLFEGRKSFPKFTEILEALSKRFEALGSDSNAFAKELAKAFPGNASRSMQKMLSVWAEYSRLQKELANRTGLTGDITAKRLNTLAGRVLIFKSNIEALSASIGQKLEPVFNELMRVGQGVVDWLNTLDAQTVRMFGKGGVMVVGISAAATVLSMFAVMMQPLISAIAAVGAAVMSSLSLPVLVAIGAVIGLIGMAGAFRKAWRANLLGVKDVWRALTDEINETAKGIGNVMDAMTEMSGRAALRAAGFELAVIIDPDNGKNTPALRSSITGEFIQSLDRLNDTLKEHQKRTKDPLRRAFMTKSNVFGGLAGMGSGGDQGASQLLDWLIAQTGIPATVFHPGTPVAAPPSAEPPPFEFDVISALKESVTEGLSIVSTTLADVASGAFGALGGGPQMEALAAAVEKIKNAAAALEKHIANAQLPQIVPPPSGGPKLGGRPEVAMDTVGRRPSLGGVTMGPVTPFLGRGVAVDDTAKEFTKLFGPIDSVLEPFFFTIGSGLDWLVRFNDAIKIDTKNMTDHARRMKDEYVGTFNAEGNFSGGKLFEQLGAFQSAIEKLISGDLIGGILDMLMQSKQFKQILEAVGAILQAVADSLGVVLEPLQPVIGAISLALNGALGALAPLFQAIGMILQPFAPVLVTLGEVLEALLTPFAMIGGLMTAMSPLLELFGTALNVLANVIKIVAQTVMIPFVAIWNGFIDMILWILDNIIDRIPGVNTGKSSKLYQNIAAQKGDIGAMWEDVKATANDIANPAEDYADKMARAGNEFVRLTKTTSELNEELRNVPDGYKVALARFRSTNPGREYTRGEYTSTTSSIIGGIGRPPGMAAGGIAYRGIYELGEQGPEMVTPLRGAGSGRGGGACIIHIHGEDWERKMQFIERKQRRRNALEGRGGSLHNAPRFHRGR